MTEPLNRALSRGLDILTLLSRHPNGLELHQIARSLSLPKSSCSLLLRTLLEKKFLRYGADTARYRLTTRLFEIGSTAVRESTVESLLSRRMRQVAQASQETVHCGLWDGTDVVYIDKAESTQSVRMTSHIGLRMPLFATAMGRAILAALPVAQAEALLEETKLSPLTPHTRTDRGWLREEIEKVRGQGYATEFEETNLSVCCVGVAVRTRQGVPEYAMSISMPLFRCDEAVVARSAELLVNAKEKIEQTLSAGI